MGGRDRARARRAEDREDSSRFGGAIRPNRAMEARSAAACAAKDEGEASDANERGATRARRETSARAERAIGDGRGERAPVCERGAEAVDP